MCTKRKKYLFIPVLVIICKFALILPAHSQNSNTNQYKLDSRQKANLQLSFSYGYLGGRKFYVNGKKVSKNEILSILESESDSQTNFKKGIRTLNIGEVIGFPAGFMFGYSLAQILRGKGPSPSTFAFSGILGGISLILTSKGNSTIHKALSNFNKKSDIGIKIKYNKNGIGLALEF